MDVADLLRGFEPLPAARKASKDRDVRFAHTLQPGLSYDEFRRRIPRDVLDRSYGGPGEDTYFTTVFACLGEALPEDSFLCAVLNHLVLQLTYQPRYMDTTGLPEILVYDGPAAYFPIAMINGNAVAGVMLNKKVEVPSWNAQYPHIDVAVGRLTSLTLTEVAEYLNKAGRQVGVVAVIAGNGNVRERYAALASGVTEYTTYLIAGVDRALAPIAQKAAEAYPSASILTRNYVSGVQCRAIILISGIPGLPDLDFDTSYHLPYTFVRARDTPDANFEIIDYKSTESVDLKPPLATFSHQPLSDYVRSQIYGSREIYHNIVSINRGLLLPSGAVSHGNGDTFLHGSEDGRLVLDFGNEEASQLRSVSKVDNTLNISALMAVSGAAMPLTFTSNLHRYYSHFVLQCLPRVKLLRELDRDIRLLVPADLYPKQVELLSLLVEPDRVIAVPRGVAVQADELIVPRAWPLAFSPYTAEIYDEVRQKVAPASGPTPRRVLISRANRTSWRNLLTFDVIRHELVHEFDFAVVRPEELALADEVALYASARLIAGAEGAGLYGSIFSDASSTIISISDEDYAMPVLGSLAAIRGFEIAYVFGESFRSDADVARRTGRGHADFVVDPQLVVAAVQRSLSRC